jgi:DNA-binding protein YbaB
VAELSNPELVEEMRWQLRKIEERKADNARLLAELAQPDRKPGASSVTTTSADRSVTVVTEEGGIVTAVRLTSDAMRSDADTLSDLITATIRGAIASPSHEDRSPGARSPQRRPEPVDDEPYDSIFDE